MLSRVHLSSRLFLSSVALLAAAVLVLSSWLPQGLLLCLHHNGNAHVVAAHDHAAEEQCASNRCCQPTSHAHDDSSCHAHDDRSCVDVVLELPEVQPHVQVLVHAGFPTVTTLSWSSVMVKHDEQRSVWQRLQQQRQRDLGPPRVCLIRTVRLQV